MNGGSILIFYCARISLQNLASIKIISKVHWRVAWLKQEEAAKRREAEKLEQERISYAQVS